MDYTKGICRVCQKEFKYFRYRADKNYCSVPCRGRQYYVTKGTYSQRNRRNKMSPEEWKEHKKDYDRQRLFDPQIRAAHNARNRARYDTEEYRLYSRNRYWANGGSRHLIEPIPIGYTGHRWFDLVRQYVGEPPPENVPWFDRWADRMGVATLALLEGRDIKEALKEHGAAEYISEHRTLRLKDWKDDNSEHYNQSLFGTSPSAEEEAIARQSTAPVLKTRYSRGSNPRRYGNGGSHTGRTAPSRRDSFKDYQDRPGSRRNS